MIHRLYVERSPLYGEQAFVRQQERMRLIDECSHTGEKTEVFTSVAGRSADGEK